jgi:hypothetical protein
MAPLHGVTFRSGIWHSGTRGLASGHEQEIFPFLQHSRPDVRSSQPPIQRVTGPLSPRVKRSEREADQAPPSVAYIKNVYLYMAGGPLMVAQWLRYCATNRKVVGSIPDHVIGIFHWHNPSDRTMALGSTQPLTKMSTRRISLGVKAAGA